MKALVISLFAILLFVTISAADASGRPSVLQMPTSKPSEGVHDDFCGPGKHMWPELVGTPAVLAVKIIEEENSNVRAVTQLAGTPVTLDFSCNRVRVFVNILDIVVQTPFIT